MTEVVGCLLQEEALPPHAYLQIQLDIRQGGFGLPIFSGGARLAILQPLAASFQQW